MAVVVPIAADYDSSGIKEAQKSIANFGQSISKSLQQAGREAKRAFDQIEAGTEDSRTAAQRLAASLDKVADTLEADLKASTKAVEALAQALGPDMAQALGQNGLKRLVTDLNRAGLTMQEIEADAGTLAASLKRLDDVNLSAVTGETKQLNAEVGRTSAEAERARGVFGGFVGGATSEIPGLTGAFGPLVQAIDQSVSGLVEGTFSLKNLVAFAGPMAALAGGIALVSSALSAHAAAAEVAKERQSGFVDSIIEGLDPVRQFVAQLREAKDIESFDPGKGLFGGVKDVLPDLVKAGVTVTTVQDVLADNEAGKAFVENLKASIKALKEEQRQLNLNGSESAENRARRIELRDELKAQKSALDFLTDTTGDLAKAEQTAAQIAAFRGETVNSETAAYNGLNSNITAAITGSALLTTATAALAAQQERNAAATAAAAKVTDDARQAFYRSVNAVYAYEDSHARAAEAVDAAAKAEAKAAKTRRPKDIEEATRLRKEATRAVSDASAAAVALEDATNKTTNELVRQTAITAAGQRELESFGQELRADSELMRGLARLLAYYQQLTGNWRIDITPGTVTPTGPTPALTAAAAFTPGGLVTVNVNVQGSIISQNDLGQTIQRALTNSNSTLGIS